MTHGLADKHLVGTGVKGHGAQLFGHAVGAHHPPCQRGGPLDVVGSAGGDIAQHQLLGGAAAQQGHDLLDHVLPAEIGAILVRQGDGHAAGLTAGHDGDLMHRVVLGQGPHHHGVARLVIGG